MSSQNPTHLPFSPFSPSPLLPFSTFSPTSLLHLFHHCNILPYCPFPLLPFYTTSFPFITCSTLFPKPLLHLLCIFDLLYIHPYSLSLPSPFLAFSTSQLILYFSSPIHPFSTFSTFSSTSPFPPSPHSPFLLFSTFYTTPLPLFTYSTLFPNPLLHLFDILYIHPYSPSLIHPFSLFSTSSNFPAFSLTHLD